MSQVIDLEVSSTLQLQGSSTREEVFERGFGLRVLNDITKTTCSRKKTMVKVSYKKCINKYIYIYNTVGKY